MIAEVILAAVMGFSGSSLTYAGETVLQMGENINPELNKDPEENGNGENKDPEQNGGEEGSDPASPENNGNNAYKPVTDAGTSPDGSGTIDDPWKIDLNTVYSGQSKDDEAVKFYFTFDIDKAGCMKPYASVVNPAHTTWNSLSVYSEEVKDYTLVFKNEAFGSEFSNIGESGLKPGKYIVVFYMKGCPSYKLKLDFTETDRYEEEIDSPSEPKKIEADGKPYYGETSNSYGDTADYYYFIIDKKTKVTVNAETHSNYYLGFKVYSDKSYARDSEVLYGGFNGFTKSTDLEAGIYYIKVTNGLPATTHYGYHFSITLGTGEDEEGLTISDNKAMKRTEVSRDGFTISYCTEIPFYGKAKPDISIFGKITVSDSSASYQVNKIKVNKKKHLIQITGLEGADNAIVKKIKKATKGSNGLPFIMNPYFVKDSDTVTPQYKKDGSLKSVKVRIKDKDYKAKKTEFSYDTDSKTITFSGSNLNGSKKLS